MYFTLSTRTPPVICFNLMCVCESPHQQSQFHHTLHYHSTACLEKGLTDSSQFTMLIPRLLCWNANGSCSAFQAWIWVFLFCVYVCGCVWLCKWMENWEELSNQLMFPWFLIRNVTNNKITLKRKYFYFQQLHDYNSTDWFLPQI